MSDAQHDAMVETINAPFNLPMPGGRPPGRGFNAPFETLLSPMPTQQTDYPAMPERPQVRTMNDFARFLEPFGSPFESPFDRATYCNAHRSYAMQYHHYQLEQERELRRQAATLPTWILTAEMVPQQVPAQEAIGWFTAQFMAGEASLIQLAHTEFRGEASVETVFTGRPERMWVTTVLLDRDLTTYASNTLEEARRTHSGSVARIIAHEGMEPTREVKKLAAVAT